MTTIERPGSMRTQSFSDPLAPGASLVAPSVFVAVRWHHGAVLLVRRWDSGGWELPGGWVDVGESAVEAAVRRTIDEAGVHVEVTEFAGLFSDPGSVVRSSDGTVRQEFALLFRARAHGGAPRGNLRTTSDAAWVPVADLAGLAMEPPARSRVDQAIAVGEPPLLR